jgi:hypothetical protein
MGSNFVLKKLFPNCRLALSAGERIPVLSRKFFWTCGRIEYRAWLGSSMQIKIHRTWNRSYSRKRKRSDHFRGDTHNANDILYTTHTQFVKTRDSLVSGKKKKKQKTNSLFFFSLWGWRCVFCCCWADETVCIKRNAGKKPNKPAVGGFVILMMCLWRPNS